MNRRLSTDIRVIIGLLLVMALGAVTGWILKDTDESESSNQTTDNTEEAYQASPSDEFGPVPTSPEVLPTEVPECDEFIIAFDITTGNSFCLQEGEALPPEAFESIETVLSCYDPETRMVTDCPRSLVEFVPPTGQAT